MLHLSYLSLAEYKPMGPLKLDYPILHLLSKHFQQERLQEKGEMHEENNFRKTLHTWLLNKCKILPH